MKSLLPFILCSVVIGSHGSGSPLQNDPSMSSQLVLSSSSIQVSSDSDALISNRTEEYIRTVMAKWEIPGLSVAVVRKDDQALNGWRYEFGGYGIADAKGSPMSADSVFAVASNSKLFLSISVGLLISNKTLAKRRGQEIKWSTKIKDLIPEWALMDDDMTQGVTLQDMLSHRTGIPRHDFSHVKGSVSEMISTLRYLRPSAEFRETFQYNNLMYETLSYLPQVLLNQTFESYITQHLFEPLNMTASTFSVAVAEERRTFANGFMWDMEDTIKGEKGTRTAVNPFFARPGEERTWAAAGGLLTSARDLATWVAMLLNNGRHPYTNQTIVPEEVIEHVAQGKSVSHGKPEFPEFSVKVYGAGQWRFSYQGRDLIEHGGDNPGYKSQVARFPDDNLGIITLCNDGTRGFFVVEAVKFRIAEEILGLEELNWIDRYETLAKKQIESAQQAAKPRPAMPNPPTAPFAALAQGTFNHPTYGTLQPCLVPSHASDLTVSSHSHAHCQSLFESHPVKRILSVSNASVPTYIIPFKRTFATHMRLTHFSNNFFNGSIFWTNSAVREQEGYGTGGDVVIDFSNFEAEWVNEGGEGGLAFKGNLWGQEGPDARSPEGTGKESAEVWFSADS